jgi:hypothetical protein
VLLVEAKSYPGEMTSSCRATDQSRELIEGALSTTRSALGASGELSAWTDRYYQLANRIAHLRWLQHRGREAWLMLVCFTGDGLRSTDERTWRSAITSALDDLGLPAPTAHGIVDVFLPVP